MRRTQTDQRGRVARDGSRFGRMTSAARRGSLARGFSAWRAKVPQEGGRKPTAAGNAPLSSRNASLPA